MEARNGPMVPPVVATSKDNTVGMRIINASGCDQNARKKKHRNPTAEEATPPTSRYFVKVSELSHKRAKSGSPLVSSIMNRKF